MSAGGWVVLVVAVGLGVVLATRAIHVLARRWERTTADSGSWRGLVARREREEGSRFAANVLFFGWPIVLGWGLAALGFLGVWGFGFGWGLFGLVVGCYSCLVLLGYVKYGSTRRGVVRRLLRREPAE
jgi:hypothetical protein